ncbi:MAG TPA: hypothetical protein VG055_24710 [Planctomycetaceae bacterium]|jgi:hypothetical protein|nr:hypothetical protein [Planctomycetaceae bacterium]
MMISVVWIFSGRPWLTPAARLFDIDGTAPAALAPGRSRMVDPFGLVLGEPSHPSAPPHFITSNLAGQLRQR